MIGPILEKAKRNHYHIQLPFITRAICLEFQFLLIYFNFLFLGRAAVLDLSSLSSLTGD